MLVEKVGDGMGFVGKKDQRDQTRRKVAKMKASERKVADFLRVIVELGSSSDTIVNSGEREEKTMTVSELMQMRRRWLNLGRELAG